MTSLLQLDNLDCTSTTSEHITKLFPKCRPRDVNLNAVSTQDDSNENTIVVMDDDNDRCARRGVPDDGGRAEEEDEARRRGGCDEDDSSDGDEEEEEEDLVIDHTGGGDGSPPRKPRDSRVIEIAGGRELFSQSRSRAVKKARLGDDMERGKRGKTQGVWELRARCADAKKQRGAREVTETVFSTEVRSVRHQRGGAAADGRGEVVVFDDIGEGWQGLRLDLQGAGQNGGREPGSSAGSSPSAQPHHRNATDFFKAVTSASDLDGDSLSPEHGDGGKVARIIGSLPIAEYEGSPRRYGPRPPDASPPPSHPVLPSAQSLLASPSVYPPRPGFPQRVVATPSEPDGALSPGGGAFDYLYEFSETRKVLEEFFRRPEDAGEDPGFRELEYELRRQAGAGSAYVGQRLAKAAAAARRAEGGDLSPGKLGNGGLESDALQDSEAHFLDLSADTASTEDLGETEVGLQVGHSRNFTLSPETTDCDSNCGDLDSEVSLLLEGDGGGVVGAPGAGGGGGGEPGAPPDPARLYSSMPVLEDGLSSGHASDTDNNPTVLLMRRQITEIEREIVQRGARHKMSAAAGSSSPDEAVGPRDFAPGKEVVADGPAEDVFSVGKVRENSYSAPDPELEALDPLGGAQMTPPPPAPQPHRGAGAVEAALKDIRLALQRTKALPIRSPTTEEPIEDAASPVWVPRRRVIANGDSEPRKGPGEEGVEEEADTDLETDRLLGQQRTDDHGFFDDKVDKDGSKKKGRNKEVLIEGVLFRARYLGSTQLVCEGQPTKTTRMMQAEEAVSRIKAPEGETQPSTEVDLFISTEKIMVLNTDLKEIMMDHALRTISYIADIGDLVVLMARRRFVPHDVEEPPKVNRTPKMICHVFESEEAQFIAQSIGQAFQVAYMEFLKANGIEDHSFVKEMDYQEVLNSQEIFGDELQMFAKKEMQKECWACSQVVVPKAKGEILGVVIVESGWGSMLPTVVIANLAPAGAAARCGQLNIGDQIIAINGVSLVGLPLSTCQNYIKNTKNQTVVKLTVVPCAPVVEVKIKRPDTKYQLGFSVQNGVICSLLRGGIAERGGVRVGHRIIEINNQSVVAVPHEKIVNLLATSVGEILMKTMPTSMFRLLTGQETPVYI
ncbi:uncharacterized protein LOC134540432 isoform X5 [Bacillus rossius redtenbacheri]|uniref:uncharacterized protein LOC134540432 isoform X5 n=1 Tax=Bacillus rossius redtenbacheri TaxID=93214 RepID=UPI002FDDDAB7